LGIQLSRRLCFCKPSVIDGNGMDGDGGWKERKKYRAYLCIWFEAGRRSAERLGCLRGFAHESLKSKDGTTAITRKVTAVIGAGLGGQSKTVRRLTRAKRIPMTYTSVQGLVQVHFLRFMSGSSLHECTAGLTSNTCPWLSSGIRARCLSLSDCDGSH
jgi:hypothetical protein